MISISNISASQAKSYYYEKDPLFPENSSWQGKTAELFGLEPGSAVGKAEFVALLAGLDPRTGEQLIPDGANGEHRAGLDLTLSAPKGYSILSLLDTGDNGLQEVFNDAVAKTLQYAENNFAQVRRSINGEKFRVDSGNLAIATFQHSLSREADPQLHTHAVIFSLSERQHDGKIVAVENRPLYENRHLLDQYFKSELASGVKELGYSITTNEKGDFDIAGIPHEVVEGFSKRRQQVLEKTAELKESGKVSGLHDAAIREQATLQSREKKTDISEAALRERWDRELAENGTSKEALQQHALAQGRHTGRDLSAGMTAEDYVKTAAKALTETESTFGKGDILKAAGKLSIGEIRVAELENAFTALLDTKSLIQLDGKENSFKGIYTTKEMFKIEKQLFAMIRNGVGRAEPLMSPTAAEKAIESYLEKQQKTTPDFAITRGQREAVYNILTSDSKYQIIQGDAGVGKSKSLEIVNQALSIYAQREITPIGLSFTGKASHELQQSSGIESMTLARFLADSEEGNSSRSNQPASEIPRHERLYIVDESSMLSSRDAYQLFQRAERDGSKVILVGDVKQLLSVQSGRLFSDVQEKAILDVTTMNEVLRQKTEEMKELVADISQKRVDCAFRKLEHSGKLHQLEDRGELIAAITAEYAGKDNWRDTLVLTHTNESRHELNQSIREELQAQGKIDSENIPLTARAPKNIGAVEKHFAQSFNEGDYTFSSKAGGGLRAGTECKILNSDQEKHELTLVDGNGNVKLFDLKQHGDKLSVYSEEEKLFSHGEKVIFLKNDSKLGVQNGLAGFIEKIDQDGNLTIKTESGEQVSFSSKNYSYLDHGAAISLHKSQGMTSDEVIYHVDAKDQNSNSLNSLYTGITRAKFDAQIFTNDAETIREQMKEHAIKTSTLDYDKTLGEIADREKMETEKVAAHLLDKEPKAIEVESGKALSAELESSKTEKVLPDKGTDISSGKDYELSL